MSRRTCPRCSGRKLIKCPRCGGRGYSTGAAVKLPFTTYPRRPCTKCNETGKVVCHDCGGRGLIEH